MEKQHPRCPRLGEPSRSHFVATEPTRDRRDRDHYVQRHEHNERVGTHGSYQLTAIRYRPRSRDSPNPTAPATAAAATHATHASHGTT